MAGSDSEEDYMTMVIEDLPETKFQRDLRKRREREERAHPKSKAELQAEAELNRDMALSTALPEDNKGFKMLAKLGYKQGQALGKSEDARKEPINVRVKEDKGGIGHETEKKRKFREQFEQAEQSKKRQKEDETDYRKYRSQLFEDKTIERDFFRAQKLALNFAEEEAESDGKPADAQPPLQDVNVFWRRIIRNRLEAKQRQHQQRDLTNSIANRPSVAEKADPDDQDNDDDDRHAQGITLKPFYTMVAEDDLDEEDEELAEFEALPVQEKLQKLITFLRETYHYCFFCGLKYKDAEMKGCPGLTEAEHDDVDE